MVLLKMMGNVECGCKGASVAALAVCGRTIADEKSAATINGETGMGYLAETDNRSESLLALTQTLRISDKRQCGLAVVVADAESYLRGNGVMASVTSKVLIIEDDRKMSEALVSGIVSAGYEVTAASSAEEGFFLAHSTQPDLLLLDLTLPHRNGLDVLRQIRKEGMDIRVLVLTSHNTVEDRVEGLRTGADDYLGKPFSFPELLARMEALLRRFLPPTPASLCVGDLSIDPRNRTASRAGTTLDLTPREFDLLLYLAENDGRIVSREMLAKDVWRETSRFTPLDNVIDVQVARLRRKVDDPFDIKLLQTVRGMGFSLRTL
jgi:DNA-binding response OmpR family regulator